jgi:hypothetical protein
MLTKNKILLLGAIMMPFLACDLLTKVPGFSAVTESPLQQPSPETPTLVPILSVPASWRTYSDQHFGFTFHYPPEGKVIDQQEAYARIIDLPFIPDTNLLEKYVDVSAVKNGFPCPSPYVDSLSGSTPSQQVTINGLSYTEQSGAGAGAGNIYEWTAYSTQRGDVCVSLTLVLHSANPMNYATPPPVFDAAAESQVFQDILGTFTWLTQ